MDVSFITKGARTMQHEAHNQQESDLPPDLAKPARRALIAAGYWRLEQVAARSGPEIKQVHGVGPTALDQLRRAFGTQGCTCVDEKSKM